MNTKPWSGSSEWAPGVSGCRRCLVAAAAMRALSFIIVFIWFCCDQLNYLLWILIFCLVSCNLLQVLWNFTYDARHFTFLCLSHSTQIYCIFICCVSQMQLLFNIYSHLALTSRALANWKHMFYTLVLVFLSVWKRWRAIRNKLTSYKTVKIIKKKCVVYNLSTYMNVYLERSKPSDSFLQ